MRKLASLTAAGVVVTLAGAGAAAAETSGAPAGRPAQQVRQVRQQVNQQATSGGTSRAMGGSTGRLAPPARTDATHSRLYRTGTLAASACSPGAIPRGSTAAYRRFLSAVTGCLNRAWGAQFGKAGLAFAAPRLRVVTKRTNLPCGRWHPAGDGVYCPSDRTVYMLITKRDLRDPFPLDTARLMAHEYGHHVQRLAGIMHHYGTALRGVRADARLRLTRRLELQAECFSAVFMSSVRGTLPVTAREWDANVDWFRRHGHKGWKENDHGSGPAQAYWMTRGFHAGSPGACDTWTAPASRVA